MATTGYVALLRGINVGGRNKVAMADLRSALEGDGLEGVQTYIQSGNVVFCTDRPSAQLEAGVESVLEQRFGMPVMVVVRSHRQLRNVVRSAPEGFGEHPDRFHSDAVFLKGPLTSSQAMRVVQLREGVDRAWPGTGVVYFERLSARRTQSRLSRIMGTPEYQRMTIRSWATTTRLLAMLDEAANG